MREWKLYSIEQLWRKFNLEKEYKEVFENEENFWNSESTFVEVYRKLKMMNQEKRVIHESKPIENFVNKIRRAIEMKVSSD